MNVLLIAVLTAGLAAGEDRARAAQPRAASPSNQARPSSPASDPVQQEYEKLLKKDETALNEIERLINEFDAFTGQGGAASKAVLNAKIDQLVDRVKKDYEDFLKRHSQHVEGHLAYGSFLNEIGDEEQAVEIWEKARELDPKNPSAWNNLANIFGHRGPVKKAFQYYEKAIELDPAEPVYVQNLATTTYLFRKDAAETYRLDEAGVFDKALELYRRALKLDPTNLVLAVDYAQSYYGIKPLREKEALAAWEHTLTLARSDLEKQGVHLHLARVNWMADRLEPAEAHLAQVTLPDLQEMKQRIQKNVEKKKRGESLAETEEAEEKNGAKTELKTSPEKQEAAALTRPDKQPQPAPPAR